MVTKDKIKLVLKGILLYTTAISICLFMAMIDSIYNNGYFIHSIIVIAALICACFKTITEEEYNTLVLTKYHEVDEDEW